MDTTDIPGILRTYKRVAVVGISANETRPSHWIARYLQDNGFEVTGVNPLLPEIPGIRVVSSLSEVGSPLEIVDVFRAPEAIPELVRELESIRPPVLWLQPGAQNIAAEEQARAFGITVVSGPCIYAEHRSLR